MKSDVQTILEQARDHIAINGHLQGHFVANVGMYETSPACVRGAIRIAGGFYTNYGMYDGRLDYQAITCLAEAVGFPADDDIVVGHMTRWNDVSGRTTEEVLSAFDKAIWIAQEKAATCP